MAEQLPMLALSPTMENGVIVKWAYEEGDTVAEGDVLCEVETDKAVMEYTSTVEGTLLKILLAEGDQANVGEPICIVGDPGEDISGLTSTAKSAPPTPAASPAPAAPVADPSTPAPAAPAAAAPSVPAPASLAASVTAGRVKSTPIARRIAEQHGVDLNQVQGTGPGGRITKRDVQNMVASSTRQIASAPGHTLGDQDLEAVLQPISNKRRIIAQRLTESKYSSPHFYMKIRAKMDDILAARKELNSQQNLKVSFNAYLIKLVSFALRRHPMVNSSWTETNIVKHGRIDIGLAVALEDGLITPIVRNCNHKGILEIDAELKDLIERARNDRLKPEEFQNSTFTISNLGAFGIEEFSAIINPPNAAILAVGKVDRVPLVNDQDELEIHSLMSMTLSCDHRVIDGTVGAGFLFELKSMLEDPIRSLY